MRWSSPFLTGSSFALSALGSTAVLGILGTGLAFVLMGSPVAQVGSTMASFAIYLIPAVAAIVSVALVIVGAVLASRKERGPEAVPGSGRSLRRGSTPRRPLPPTDLVHALPASQVPEALPGQNPPLSVAEKAPVAAVSEVNSPWI